MAKVSVRNLTKKFISSHAVLDDISLEIADGEFVVLVGPSGCGKTTLLRIIAGLESVTAGEVRIGDRVVNDLGPAERDIAFVFQDYALYPHFTARQNMSFGLEIRKLPKEEVEKRIRYAAGFLQIEHLLERKPRALSGGQRQRVAMGRAIVRQPQVYLFDEPLSNLDAKLRVEVRTEIRKLFQTFKTTMVYVTHDQVEAMTMADRIVVFKDGVIQQSGSPGEIYSRPVNRFVAEFIGSPSMNFFAVEASNALLTFAAAKTTIPVPPHLREAVQKFGRPGLHLGIRPENLRLDPQGAIKARVSVVEPLGADTLVFFSFGTGEHCLRVPPEQRVEVDEEISLSFDPAKSHLFCRESGRAV